MAEQIRKSGSAVGSPPTSPPPTNQQQPRQTDISRRLFSTEPPAANIEQLLEDLEAMKLERDEALRSASALTTKCERLESDLKSANEARSEIEKENTSLKQKLSSVDCERKPHSVDYAKHMEFIHLHVRRIAHDLGIFAANGKDLRGVIDLLIVHAKDLDASKVKLVKPPHGDVHGCSHLLLFIFRVLGGLQEDAGLQLLKEWFNDGKKQFHPITKWDEEKKKMRSSGIPNILQTVNGLLREFWEAQNFSAVFSLLAFPHGTASSKSFVPVQLGARLFLYQYENEKRSSAPVPRLIPVVLNIQFSELTALCEKDIDLDKGLKDLADRAKELFGVAAFGDKSGRNVERRLARRLGCTILFHHLEADSSFCKIAGGGCWSWLNLALGHTLASTSYKTYIFPVV